MSPSHLRRALTAGLMVAFVSVVPACAETLDKVDALRPEFIRLCTTGERQSPAVKATAQLVAEGVDLADPVAVEEWLAAYNARN